MQAEIGSAPVRPLDLAPLTRPLAADPDPAQAEFAAMRADYQSRGGFARGDELTRLLERRAHGSLAGLARLIVAGEVFGFEWRHTLWVPMFQFNADLSLKAGLKAVLAELASEYDGQRLAAWFVEPNAWLDDALPIDVLETNADEVLQAARADRFVATG